MLKITYGIVVSLIFCLITTFTMLTINTNNKKMLLFWTFLNRVAICIFIAALMRPIQTWPQGLAYGLIIGSLFSITDALMTKKYFPIVIVSSLGGIIIAVVINSGIYLKGF